MRRIRSKKAYTYIVFQKKSKNVECKQILKSFKKAHPCFTNHIQKGQKETGRCATFCYIEWIIKCAEWDEITWKNIGILILNQREGGMCLIFQGMNIQVWNILKKGTLVLHIKKGQTLTQREAVTCILLNPLLFI